ncbi:hypothetical protein EC973_005071 [Apophysomyces ossiformis]|uniref:BHLH domain-containing protein n=1 Tax=Apophysomyces ossiformis TaxID=679940 RepID=A0A8H7BUN4_9FUNG|nr:hypothetical protein EC973_005071 [Apophysomyces ossiformis]
MPRKPASITSINSDNPPSLYSGRDSVSSLCGDVDELQEPCAFEDFQFSTGLDPGLSIQVPFEIDPYLTLQQDIPENTLLNDNDQKTFGEFLNSFIVDEEEEEEENLEKDRLNLPKNNDHESTVSILEPNRKRRPSADSKHELRRVSLTKRSKTNRDLLTEEEKRANHIASEQKRRNTIRNGFKDLTEIIPTLKNINNSKSTILFKAVDYIKHLEKRNKGLRERLAALQMRAEVKGRMAALVHRPTLRKSTSTEMNHHHLPPEAVAALMAHKNQQKQLEILQEQLRLQQELLAKHNITRSSTPSLSIPSDAQHQEHSSSLYSRLTEQQKLNTYNSISIPSSGPPSPRHPVNNMPYHHRSSAPALVMPVTDEEHPLHDWHKVDNTDAPSLNIPADEDFGKETAFRERFLSCGKLKHLQTSASP